MADVEVVAAAIIGPKGPPGQGNSIWQDESVDQDERGYIDIHRPLVLRDDAPGNAHHLELPVGPDAGKVAAGDHTHAALYDAIGAAAAALTSAQTYAGGLLTAHVAAGDPHGQYVLESTVGAANGVAQLDAGGKLPSSIIPAVALSETYTVASQAAMLALSAQVGDLAIRTDLSPSVTYILGGTGNPATLTDWIQVTFGGAVSSVNGQTGAVSLTATDVGAVPTSTKDAANGVAGLDAGGLILSSKLPTVPISKGGTGQTAKAAAFDALSPATTKGDLLGFSTTGVRIPAGTNGLILAADSTQTNGVKYERNGGSAVHTNLGLYSFTGLTNSTARTKLFAFVLPAGILALGGDQLSIQGTLNMLHAVASNLTFEWEITDGTTTVSLASAATTLATNANVRRHLFDALLSLHTTGAAGAALFRAAHTFGPAGASDTIGADPTNWPISGATLFTPLNLTLALTLNLYVTYSAASASNLLLTQRTNVVHHFARS